MAAEPKTIKVVPGSDLAKILADAAGETVILESAGAYYQLAPVKTERERPSPEEAARSRDAILKAAGGWQGLIDAGEFKAYVRERRHTANRHSIKL